MVWLASVGFACASTNDVTTLVQKGLFEEEANHHLDAAMEYYKEAIGHFDKDRQLAATAIFHLGECYRLQGKTNEANEQYQRIVHEFSDQTQLVELSRGYLPKGVARSSFSQSLTKVPGANGYTVGASVPIGREAIEIQLINDLIQNSPDLVHASERLISDVRASLPAAVNLLLENGASINPAVSPGQDTPLTAATIDGNKGMVEFLLSKGANINALDWNEGRAPLHYAAEKGFKSITETLLAHGADVDVADTSGDRPLHIAVDHGFKTMAEVLLAHKADVNAPGKNGETALFRAINDNHVEMVQFLISNKANVNIKSKSGVTPLISAVWNGSINIAIVKALLDNGADVEASPGGRHPLESAILQHRADVVELLLQKNANPNLADESNGYGSTPLGYAIGTGNTNIVADLIAHHADVNATDKQGDPPLAYASRRGDDGKIMKQMLIAAGANEDYQRRGAIFIAQKGTGSIGQKVFYNGTSAVNRYTLFELIAKTYAYSGSGAISFPDFAHVTINRLKSDWSKEEITVDLNEMLQSGDCSKNPGLEWGDVVLIPQLDHNVNAGWQGLSQSERGTLGKCLLRTVKVVVKGQTTTLALLPPIVRWYSFAYNEGRSWSQQDAGGDLSASLTTALNGEKVLYNYDLNQVVHDAKVLLISSDLSRVKVSRSASKAGEHPLVMEFNLETQPPPVLQLLDGDVIEIPERDRGASGVK